MKKEQKFHRGDLVHIAENLRPSMSHFTSGVDAIIIGSYNDQYGGGDVESYTVYIEGKGEHSWYDEDQLTLVEPNRIDILHLWKSQAEQKAKLESNLDWIFANGQTILNSASGATVQALGRCLGITNLWGSHGEAMTYYINAMTILKHAEPFLKAGNKDGWLVYAQETKEKLHVR